MSSFVYNIIKKHTPFLFSKNVSEEGIKFVIYGILCNVIVIIIYQIFLFFINYKLAALLVYALGFLLTFYANSIMVFNNRNLRIKHGIKYVLLYLFNCVIAYFGLIFLESILSVAPRIGFFVITFCSASLSFIVSKKIFKSPT